jgi:2-(1,2-epoxy-1,2-dihydrophenyl)acetyl-CoA isomerase
MTYEHILFDVTGDVATLTIKSPCAAQRGIPADTFRKDGRSRPRSRRRGPRAADDRCSARLFLGADLSTDGGTGASRSDMGRGLELGFNPLLERLARLPVPVVAAVNGVARGEAAALHWSPTS